MKYRFSLIALVSAVSLPALATSGITAVPGEAGFTTHAMPSAKSRADVIKELEAWKRNPVTADGWREVGGEAGWVFVGTNNPSKTRAAVIAETIEARRNPVTADGWLEGYASVDGIARVLGLMAARLSRPTPLGDGATLLREGHAAFERDFAALWPELSAFVAARGP